MDDTVRRGLVAFYNGPSLKTLNVVRHSREVITIRDLCSVMSLSWASETALSSREKNGFKLQHTHQQQQQNSLSEIQILNT